MKWIVLALLLTGCTGTATITVRPIQPTPKNYRHHYKVHPVHYRPSPTPIPTSSVSPSPPDSRMQDVIKALKP